MSTYAAQPVYAPQQQPVYGEPMPAQQPTYGQPMQQPMYGQPMQQPTYGQPMQQPTYGQPMQQPMYAQQQMPGQQQPAPESKTNKVYRYMAIASPFVVTIGILFFIGALVSPVWDSFSDHVDVGLTSANYHGKTYDYPYLCDNIDKYNGQPQNYCKNLLIVRTLLIIDIVIMVVTAIPGFLCAFVPKFSKAGTVIYIVGAVLSAILVAAMNVVVSMSGRWVVEGTDVNVGPGTILASLGSLCAYGGFAVGAAAFYNAHNEARKKRVMEMNQQTAMMMPMQPMQPMQPQQPVQAMPQKY